jgi:putative ABC transport system ATP-binding protein
MADPASLSSSSASASASASASSHAAAAHATEPRPPPLDVSVLAASPPPASTLSPVEAEARALIAAPPAAAPAGAPAPAPSAARKEPAAELVNVHKTYLLGLEGVPALRGVSLRVERGEFVVVLGKSGGGKTSLLNVLGTIDRPSRGELRLCGERVDAATPDATLAALRLSRIAFVFQAFNLLPGLTALENVELPLVLAGAPAGAAARELRAAQLLAQVGMAERLDHFPGQLSGGEQQRVTIARALANAPELLLLDEPTGDLDSHNGDIVLHILTRLNASPAATTCVMVTHDVALRALAHRVVHMLDGRVARVEDVPAFVREEALRALAERPSVVAWEREQARQAAALVPEAEVPWGSKTLRINDAAI